MPGHLTCLTEFEDGSGSKCERVLNMDGMAV